MPSLIPFSSCNKKKRFWTLILLCFISVNCQAQNKTSIQSVNDILFEDGFEDDMKWTMFEEIIDTNYTDSAGEIKITTEASNSGLKSLSVHANKEMTMKSNHVSAIHKVFNNGGTAGVYEYSLYAMIDSIIADPGQTGPEFCVERTLLVGDKYITYTAGIQFIPNPWINDGKGWNIWDNGTWIKFLDLALQKGVWYYLSLKFDYSTNSYISFVIKGAGIDTTVDISQYTIAGIEKGFTEEALWIALEAENLWTGSNPQAVQYRMFYDDVKLTGSAQTSIHGNLKIKTHNKSTNFENTSIELYNLLGRCIQINKQYIIAHQFFIKKGFRNLKLVNIYKSNKFNLHD